jgi:hypothetical protein
MRRPQIDETIALITRGAERVVKAIGTGQPRRVRSTRA